MLSLNLIDSEIVIKEIAINLGETDFNKVIMSIHFNATSIYFNCLSCSN